ncbi:MAG: gamma-glutamyltransferase [Gammaproteobacteria bacterium]|jgi:gamma-glutamyltranspeptidase/glutathione hydrolase|nr:gamma-glutamyltransferase [Gammaproteobacteria bacterium]
MSRLNNWLCVRCLAVVGLAASLSLSAPLADAQEHTILSSRDIVHPVIGRRGMVATQEAAATRIGVQILKDGGNAVDAAVAVGFTLAVTLPRAGNLGGGGFMVIHMADRGETVALDYREMAPAGASRDMYLDDEGNVDRDRATSNRKAVGVPGTVAGMVLALETYGTMDLASVMAPAIALARDGVTVTEDLSLSLRSARRRLGAEVHAEEIFYKGENFYLSGDTLRQPELTWSLQQISDHGADAFYRGEIAERIALDMAANGGLINADDLSGYAPIIREPVRGTYRGFEIVSMPPPSSGGTHVIQILNMLEAWDIESSGHNTAETIHRVAEVSKLAYADRAQHLGDPAFWDVPVEGLTSKAYASSLREKVDLEQAMPSDEIQFDDPLPFESNETTHFSVMDEAGNVVSNTYTLNFSYGSGLVAEGTGIILNNQMDNLSAKPGVPNAYGMLGGDANAIAPGKRPLSSMSPTILFKDGEAYMAVGSPGGSTIITTVLQMIMNVVDHKMNIAEATYASRFQHQLYPNTIRAEEGLNADSVRLLEAKGHEVTEISTMGSTQSILRGDGMFLGSSDPRRPSALTLGY